MNPEFWQKRWESGQLGFHQEEINALLTKFWSQLRVPNDASVFVPLCGKSLDMRWIREQGHPVLGVELSPIAIRDYFGSISSSYQEQQHGALHRYSGSGYELYCGDLFELEESDLSTVRAVYDRASLIALPPEMRRRYAAKLIEVLPTEAKILLVTLDYDQEKMSGPPHSVPPAEVEALFGRAFEIEDLEAGPPSEPAPRFKERGLDRWQENVQLLTRRDTEVRGA